MTGLFRRMARLGRREDGSVTLEFVIIFPVFMILFVSCFELGTIMLRQTMLDRSIDMVVRDIRVGQVDFGTGLANETPQERARRQHDILKELICEQSNFLEDCANEIKIEMQVVDPRAWTGLEPDIDCIDQSDVNIPPRRFEVGEGNQLVLLRACHLFEPFIKNFGLGTVLGDLLRIESGNSYRIVSSAAYVIEPES